MDKSYYISLCLGLSSKRSWEQSETAGPFICNLTMKWWEWMKTGAYLGAKTAWWSLCDRSSCPLVEHSMEECLFVITPLPSQTPSLPGNYHKLYFSCPPEPKELSGQGGRIVTLIIFFFFSFSVHRLIFQEGLSLLYGKAERGIESKVGVGCRGVGGCGDMGLQCKSLLTFSIFFFLTDHFHAGYQGVWPIIGMQIAADGVPQQKKRTG